MTTAAEITRRLDHDGYVVLPQRIGGEELAAAREEIAVLLDPCCSSPAACGTAPAPTPAPRPDSGSSSTTRSHGSARARHTLSADPGQVRQLPQRLQELLGFNQPSPYLGFINGTHPRDWLLDNHPHSSPQRGHPRPAGNPSVLGSLAQPWKGKQGNHGASR
jgi:hypothetical protein